MENGYYWVKSKVHLGDDWMVAERDSTMWPNSPWMFTGFDQPEPDENILEVGDKIERKE